MHDFIGGLSNGDGVVLVDDQICLVGGNCAARGIRWHDGARTKFEKGLMHLRLVVGKIDLLLPGGGVQRHAIAGLHRTGKEMVRRIARARQALKRVFTSSKYMRHEAASRGSRHDGFIRVFRFGVGSFRRVWARGARSTSGPASPAKNSKWPAIFRDRKVGNPLCGGCQPPPLSRRAPPRGPSPGCVPIAV